MGLCIIAGVVGLHTFGIGSQLLIAGRAPRVRARKTAAIAAFRPNWDK
jgi:hypothetical protein